MDEKDIKLLDRFAGQAMQALLQAHEETYLREARAWEQGELDIEEASLGYDHIDIADEAYHMAEQMLVARETQIEAMEIEQELQDNGKLKEFLQSDVYSFFFISRDIPSRLSNLILNSSGDKVKNRFSNMTVEQFMNSKSSLLARGIKKLGPKTIKDTKDVIRQEIQRLKNDNENEGK